MSAKEQAVLDIKNDLKAQGKCFIAFRSELNPVMHKLVTRQIMEQKQHALFPSQCTRTNSQLMAHCFFLKGQVKLFNYSSYYENK